MIQVKKLIYKGNPYKDPVSVNFTKIKDDEEGVLEVSCLFGYKSTVPKNIHIFKNGKGIRLNTKKEESICKEILREIKKVSRNLNESQTMLYRVEVSGVNGAFKGIFVNQIEPTAIHSLLVQKMGIEITLDEVQQIVGELVTNRIVNCEEHQFGVELKVFEANEFVPCDDIEVFSDNDSDVEVEIEDDLEDDLKTENLNESKNDSYSKFL